MPLATHIVMGNFMDIAAVKNLAYELIGNKEEKPHGVGYRLAHGYRVGLISEWLAHELGESDDLLFVAGILHDIGKDKEAHPEDDGVMHGPRGAEIIRTRFIHYMCVDEMQRIAIMVENHNARPKSKWFIDKEKPNLPTEVLIIQDADLLDHFGEEGINITLNWGRFFKKTREQILKEWKYGERVARMHEEVRRSLNFDISVKEFDRRIKIMQEYFARF